MKKASDRIILGTVQFGMQYGINNTTGLLSENKIFDLLLRAREHGITTLDTAEAYGNSHDVLGKFNAQYEPFKIITKLKSPDEDPSAQIQNILNDLHIKSLEVFMFHSPSEFNRTTKKTFKVLQDLSEKGTIKKIGVSVYTNEEAIEAAKNPLIKVIQLPFNLLDNLNKRKTVFADLKQKGVEIHVRSVFLQGLFFMKPSLLPSSLIPLKDDLIMLREIAEHENLSMEKLALGYVNRINEIDKVILGVENTEQLNSNIENFNFRLNDKTFTAVNAIDVNNTDLLFPYNWNK